MDEVLKQGSLAPGFCDWLAELVAHACLSLEELALCFTSTNLVEAWLDTLAVLRNAVGLDRYAPLFALLLLLALM